MFHFAKKFVRDLRVIVTDRPFHESVNSWAHQRKCSRKESQKIIGDTLYARDLQLSEFGGSAITVRYHELICNPAEVERIALFTGREVTEKASSFVDPKLKRF